MAKPYINNYDDLMAEKERLKAEAKMGRQQIKESFEALKDELNPFSGIKETAQGALSGDTANPIVKLGINTATEFLVGKIFLRRAGWLPRLILPFVIKNVASGVVGNKPNKKIARALHSFAEKIRGSKNAKYLPRKVKQLHHQSSRLS